MPLNPEELTALLEKGQVEKCVKFFAGASETERQSLAKLSERWLRDVSQILISPPQEEQQTRMGQQAAGRVAVYAACSFSTIKSLGWRIHPIDDVIVRVLADRRPKWLDDFAEYLLEGDSPSWFPVRRLMLAGLCSKPKHDNYVLGMTHLFGGVGGHVTVPTEQQGKTRSEWGVLKHLLAEPDLLDDVWRLFEMEGSGEYSLAAHDKFSKHPAHRWDASLVEFSKRGVLSRERLLDASLDALDRGFAQFRVGWFSAFHELLKPTLDERAARQDRYLRLLASPIPPTVSFALAALEIIDKERPLPGMAVVEAARPLMLARQKGTVKSGLKLLDKIARREPEQSSFAARVAAEALVHEASDVQVAALKLIASVGSTSDAELVAAVTNAQSSVAASVRKSVADWLASGASGAAKLPGTTKAGPPIAEAFADFAARAAKLPDAWRVLAGVDRALAALMNGQIDVTGCEFDGTEFPRLDPDKAIRPIETLDELIDVAAALIEKSENYDEIERLYDGVSRLCDQRPGDFEKRTGPLLKRVRDLIKRKRIIPFTGHDPASDMIGVILAWLIDEYGSLRSIKLHGNASVEYTFQGETNSFYVPQRDLIGGAMATRARQLADRVAKRLAVRTLCAPTHAGGWIDPTALADRVADEPARAAASDLEKALALLRLAPDHRADALSRLSASKDEFVAALRYALGEPMKTIGPTDWLWIAAARARSPWADDVGVETLHPQGGPDAGIVATTSFLARIQKESSAFGDYKIRELKITVAPAVPSKDIDPRLLSVLLWKPVDRRMEDPEFVSAPLMRQLFSIRPLAQEAACSWGAQALGDNLDWGGAQWHNRVYLELLLDPDVPLRPMALLMLVLGLAAKEPGEHGLATDVAIAAIEDGRLDPNQLGSVMAELLPTGYIKAARWAKTLGEVSRVSPLHAEVVRSALVVSLHCDPMPPRLAKAAQWAKASSERSREAPIQSEAMRSAVARSLRGDPNAMPKDMHALIELLKELVVETKTAVDDEARQFLDQIVGSSKLGKAAKAILAAKEESDPQQLSNVQRGVVEQRLARVERWMARR